MKAKTRQMSESLRLGILLAIVGGFLEAYTFFCRGGVFANCQTGNLVMFALSAADGNGADMILYLSLIHICSWDEALECLQLGKKVLFSPDPASLSHSSPPGRSHLSVPKNRPKTKRRTIIGKRSRIR